MKRKHYFELKHTFDPSPFEVFCSGTWKAVENLRIENGSMSMRLFENGDVLEDVRPFQRLRLRSRKATSMDCTSFLRHGVDVCVLYQENEATPEHDLEPVWVDAKIVSIERKPHESECLCKFYVSIYIDQGCIGLEKHRMNRASVLVELNQISILQMFHKEQTLNRFYRWRFSEDCASLVKTRLTLGKFLPDLTWLLVTSVLKSIVFQIRTIQGKIVYQIVTGEGASSSSLSAMNITSEDGVFMSKVVLFNPAEDDTHDLDLVHVKQESEEEVMELRRSKRRNVRPDRFAHTESQLDSKDGWVRMMPYRYSTWTDDDEDDDQEDTDDEYNLPLSHFIGKKSSTDGFSKNKERAIVMVDKTEKKKKNKKRRDVSGTNRELSVIPFTPVFEPIPLEQFGLNANSFCVGECSGSHLMDEIDKYRSKDVKYGKKKMSELDEMESDLCWIDNHGKSVQKRNGPHSRVRFAYGQTGNSDEPQIYKKRTLSAGAYNKLIESYMSNIDSTIAAKKEANSVVEQWEELKNATSTSMEAEDRSSEDDVDEGETSENEMLWREMELCLASSYILDDNEVRVDNEAFQKATSDCEHDYELNEEIGMCCRVCGHVGMEIKHVSAPFARHKKWTTEAKHINEEDINTKVKEDGVESCNFSMPVATSETPSAEGSDNVWSLIPQLKRKLHMHQKKAFEFLWRNLAGSVVPAMMDPSSEKIGGCVISHSPGAGKTFLIIAFLASYLKIFPGKRPLVLAPKTTLYTWYKEFIKWEIPVPVHLIHGRRTYCVAKENKIQFKGIPKPSQDVSHVIDCLDKIQKWHAQPSVLVMGYTSFLTLMREDSKFAHRKYMAKVLRESPGLLVLDEGHNPRSTKSRLRKALMKVDTGLRIMLSGTLFQNNFCEYFNTLCLARPKFVHEVLMELDQKFETNQVVQKAPHLLENRARKFFLDIIAKKIDTKVGDERLQGLNMLRNMTSDFIDNYEGSGSGSGDVLPGLQIYTLLMNSTDVQHKTLTKLQKVMSTYHGYPLELELLITLAAIHPWLVKTSTCCAKFFNPEELFEIEKLKHDAKRGSKVMFVLNLVFRVVKREKILIFCHNIAPIRLFLELFENVFRWKRGRELLTLTGDLELFERGRVIDKFEEPGGPSRVLLASITACAEGISLTAASRVIMLDSEWNPSKTKQAIARAFRPGQQKVVYVYQLLSRGTLEEDKYRRTTWKEWVSSMIFSEEFVEDPSLWQAEKIEDDVLREIVEEDKVKSFHMIMKNEKASTG